MTKPYLVAQICFNPDNPEFPWYCTRTGNVPEQGGLAIGTENVSFQHIEQVTMYLREMIQRDENVIRKLVKIKECKINGNFFG